MRQSATGISSWYYNGPASNSSLTTALTTLSAKLSAPQGAVEMWMYNNGLNNYHMVEVTPDKKYLFQAGISGSTLSVDVYPLVSPGSTAINLVPTTGHYYQILLLSINEQGN